MRRVLATVLVCLLALPAGAATLRPGVKHRCRDRADRARPIHLAVDGETATGRYSVPRRKRPVGLAVFAHGYGHTAFSWDAHMREASRHGLIAVTMDYRGLEILPDDNGDGLPSSRGWPAMAGAEDLIAAASFFSARCRLDDVTLLSVSMGGNMAGLALALAGEHGITKRDGSPLFDQWIDVEGSVNLVETYQEARAAGLGIPYARNAQQDIEAETGGSFEQRPQAFHDRTVVARVDDIAASGVEGAVVIHGLDDGLVPYNQGREMATLLARAGIPTDMLTVTFRDEDSEQETTVTGYAGTQLDPDYRSPLAGHASEKSSTHIVMQTALERLWAISGGEVPTGYRECTVNGAGPQRVACAPALS